MDIIARIKELNRKPNFSGPLSVLNDDGLIEDELQEPILDDTGLIEDEPLKPAKEVQNVNKTRNR